MNSLAELSLPKTLDTSTADIIEDFFVPVLARAARYDRGVGFFSSGWLRIAAKGMVPFAANGGRGRWVTSPILSEVDWEALQMGDAARDDPILQATLAGNINDPGPNSIINLVVIIELTKPVLQFHFQR